MYPMALAEQTMMEFADSTGLSDPEKPPRRYLWTDAFAVCNFLAFYRQTGDKRWHQLALHLVHQVHDVLGHHRQDDSRNGWISGLTDEEGHRHPTAGGLRIGKPVNERKPSETFDPQLEWDRDGQYYHYLIQWMHALSAVSHSTQEMQYHIWAMELAKAAHAGFVHSDANGSKRMYWKMSIDLSYPLVPSMGQHDPLDGLITYNQLKASVPTESLKAVDLESEIADMATLCLGKDWTTDDPLGIGLLLCDAYRVMQLIVYHGFEEMALLVDLLDAAHRGMDAFMKSPLLTLPADYRLAFRELGLAIGLHTIPELSGLIQDNPGQFPGLSTWLNPLEQFIRLSETVETFWLKTENRRSANWREHGDINAVMLATSLNPSGYLDLWKHGSKNS